MGRPLFRESGQPGPPSRATPSWSELVVVRVYRAGVPSPDSCKGTSSLREPTAVDIFPIFLRLGLADWWIMAPPSGQTPMSLSTAQFLQENGWSGRRSCTGGLLDSFSFTCCLEGEQ